jgi:hypothetical protein
MVPIYFTIAYKVDASYSRIVPQFLDNRETTLYYFACSMKSPKFLLIEHEFADGGGDRRGNADGDELSG